MSTSHKLAIIDKLPSRDDADKPVATSGSSKFHLSLNVEDLPAAAAFLELLLGSKPALLHTDYAKFELADPPLVLSLAPTDVPTSSGLNHLGFRLPNREVLTALQQRLSAAGVSFDVEESIACCHSRQTKFWVHDPAGNLWEFYVLEEPGACDSSPPIVAPNAVRTVHIEPATNARWAHRLGEPPPVRIPADDDTLDEVVFEGTFNAELSNGQLALILNEAARALRIGGSLLMHGLTADRPLIHPPKLPGPAAPVKHVPTTNDVLNTVQQAGFADLELVTFGETYRFTHAGAELRETRIRAQRAGGKPDQLNRIVIYRGPFAEVRDDAGHIFRRGEPTRVDEQSSDRLRQSTCAANFVFVEPVSHTGDGRDNKQK